jgi:hypothetical protein
MGRVSATRSVERILSYERRRALGRREDWPVMGSRTADSFGLRTSRKDYFPARGPGALRGLLFHAI